MLFELALDCRAQCIDIGTLRIFFKARYYCGQVTICLVRGELIKNWTKTLFNCPNGLPEVKYLELF
jgi:hypothetical protein